jgi:hypothetical protein
MDDIFSLSQRIVDEITPQEKVAKSALAFQRVNELIQKISEILETIETHHLNKHTLVDQRGLDWWQKEQFDLHSRFFEKLYSVLSALQFVCSFYPTHRDLRGKKNSNSKFIKNLRTMAESDTTLQSSLDAIERARQFRSDYFTHSMNAGSVDWVTISDRVYFIRDPKDGEQTSGMFIGKVVVAIPNESEIYQSLLAVLRFVYLSLLKNK